MVGPWSVTGGTSLGERRGRTARRRSRRTGLIRARLHRLQLSARPARPRAGREPARSIASCAAADERARSGQPRRARAPRRERAHACRCCAQAAEARLMLGRGRILKAAQVECRRVACEARTEFLVPSGRVMKSAVYRATLEAKQRIE